MGTVSRNMGIVDDNALLRRASNGDNHWHTVGSYNDMMTVNRAFDGTPATVDLVTASGNRSVQVFGARSAREVAAVQDALPAGALPEGVLLVSGLGLLASLAACSRTPPIPSP